MLDDRIPEELTVRRAGQIIAVITLVIAVGAGLLMRVIDHNEFPSFGSGLWWSIQTVTTVGYGDHVPSTTAGQLVAVFVMVSGLGFLSVVTASITAMFVESARSRRRSPTELTLSHIMERLDQIEALMDQRLKADQRRTDEGDAESVHGGTGPRGPG